MENNRENDAPQEVLELAETIDAPMMAVEEPTPVPSTAEVPPAPESSAVKATLERTVEDARAQVDQLMERKELDEGSSSSLQTLFREHEALKDKVSKLKALLGRSAKAQREAKMESEAAHKTLDATMKENQRLSEKIEKLASRPTHMELLADFETNFDRALLSVGHLQHQTGGQDTSGAILRVESPIKERSTLDLSGNGGGRQLTDAGAVRVEATLGKIGTIEFFFGASFSTIGKQFKSSQGRDG
jgi:hypothetical protein